MSQMRLALEDGRRLLGIVFGRPSSPSCLTTTATDGAALAAAAAAVSRSVTADEIELEQAQIA